MDLETYQSCPQCRDLIQGNAKRIIRDTCGHQKCRVCLLLDVDGCRQCRKIEDSNFSDNIQVVSSSLETTSIENHHATVITYNINNETTKSIPIEEDNQLFTAQDEIQSHDCDTENISTMSQQNRRKNSVPKKMRSLAEKRAYNAVSVPSHILIEGKPPVFKCSICSSKFRTKNHVKYHIFCLGEKKPHSCSICSKSFILKSQLQIHRLIHSDKRPHACGLCGKAFRESAKLKRHMVLHSDDKPHICDECGKSFKASSSLKEHRLVHTGEKPFACKYCKMKFSNSSNLKKHIISHSDEKTHMCEQCGKKFKQKWALTVHRRSHLHIREFICRECGRGFVNQKDLKRHELIHLDSKMYSCSLCAISFRRKDNLGRHIRNTHPDKNVDIIKTDIEPLAKIKKQVTDNPNAINVITASPNIKKNENVDSKVVPSPRTCMNGPLKLAFKTSAFKRNYNINRDYTFDSNSKGETTTNKNNPSDVETKSQRNSPPTIFHSVFSTPNFSVDELYARRPHVIKNIKFKIPDNYPTTNESILETIMPQTFLTSQSENFKESNSTTQTPTSHVVGTKIDSDNASVIPTSVIVNSSDQRNMHWRRRMSQNVVTEKR